MLFQLMQTKFFKSELFSFLRKVDHVIHLCKTPIVLALSNSCALSSLSCNCDKDVGVWCEDNSLLADKTKLPVKRNSSILRMSLGLKNAAIHGTALTCFSLNR